MLDSVVTAGVSASLESIKNPGPLVVILIQIVVDDLFMLAAVKSVPEMAGVVL